MYGLVHGMEEIMKTKNKLLTLLTLAAGAAAATAVINKCIKVSARRRGSSKVRAGRQNDTRISVRGLC